MERTKIDSTSIEEVGYDEDSQTLEIEFKNGSVYQYFDVPKKIHEDLMSAGSAGAYLAKSVKGHFRFSRT